jgi:hypothetical protein
MPNPVQPERIMQLSFSITAESIITILIVLRAFGVLKPFVGRV